MDQEIWQRLLSLESVDIVKHWSQVIHGRTLKTCRTKAINFSAKQAREYFRNAYQSAHSVRPLLTYYGVASLSRAIVLLLSREGGEEQLCGGHGLEQANWQNQLSGIHFRPTVDTVLKLKVKTGNGLFADLINATENRTYIRIYDSPNYSINYRIPRGGQEISLLDIISRLPDLSPDFAVLSIRQKYTHVGSIDGSAKDNKVEVIFHPTQFEPFRAAYEKLGYEVGENNLKSDFSSPPFFIHTYVSRRPLVSEDTILYIAEPFADGAMYSQLCVTYVAAYFLGMLVRYYPSYWMSLIDGANGDAIWPAINRLQNYVETAYPEMVIEFIHGWMNPNIQSLSRTAP